MGWFQQFAYRVSQFMAGRYGGDFLSLAMVITYFILTLFANLLRLPLLSWLALLLLIWVFYRVLSRNIWKRQRENEWFVRRWSAVSGWFRSTSARFHAWQQRATDRARDRQTSRYFKCPNCRNTLRVPKGRGKIVITCPVCRTEFIKKT